MSKFVKQIFGPLLDGLLEKNSQYRSNYTPPDHLQDFIRQFHPLDVGIDLIRLGGDGDGGYLVPDDLSGVIGCFSPGVSSVADFEADLANKYGIPSYLADASVDAPPAGSVEFDFEKKFLGGRNDAITTTLGSWVEQKIGDQSGDLILQMDIEGGEYEVLPEISTDLLNRFRVIVLELHFMDDLFLPPAFKYMSIILKGLIESHSVVHLHPNNWSGVKSHRGIGIPPLLEVTLLRNDRIKGARNQLHFPHALDRRNVADKPDYPLPGNWFGDSSRL